MRVKGGSTMLPRDSRKDLADVFGAFLGFYNFTNAVIPNYLIASFQAFKFAHAL
jgi:hypothetical protein